MPTRTALLSSCRPLELQAILTTKVRAECMARATCVAFSTFRHPQNQDSHTSCPKQSYTPGSTYEGHDCYIKAQWRLATEQQRGWNCSEVCAARGEKCLGKVAMPSNTVRLRVCFAPGNH